MNFDPTKLKPGDEVIVHGKNYDYVEKVKKVTPSGRVTVGGHSTQFSKQGYHGSGWDRIHISMATPEELRRVKSEHLRRNLLRILDNANWELFSTRTLQAIVEGLRSGEMPAMKLEREKK